MGIQGLIGLMERASTPVHINQLSGSVCVIDGNGWLHRAGYGCAQQLYYGEDTDLYVNYCLKRTEMLMNCGIKPIIIFDGQRLPAKEVTHNSRQSMRHNIRQKIELLISDGKESKAKDLMRSCVEVTPEMIRNLMSALRLKSIDFIVAPFEADAQMAYLVNNGFADFVITEDSDLLVFNCKLCLFKLDLNGNGKLIDMSLITECLGDNFNPIKLRHMSILSGCDYLPNLPGIGLQRAKKFFKLTSNTDLTKLLYKVPDYLNLTKKVKITEEYVRNFIKADNTFKYQIVFCPKQRKLVPLMPYESGIKAEDIKYAGTYFDGSLAKDFDFQYAIGNVDIKTLKIVDFYCFESKSDSIWSENWFTYKKEFTKNSLILQKLSSSKVLNTKVTKDNICHRRRQFSETIESESPQKSQYFRKRIKVEENGLINSSQIIKEYSSQNNETNQNISSGFSLSQKSQTSQKRIYSRNVFKVNKDFIEEKGIQSKYFSDQRFESSSKVSVLQSNDCQKLQELSQYSLNSSGNTEIMSNLDETLAISDDEKSEVSETSDEEIFSSNSFTKLKTKNNSKEITPPLNSTFIDSIKRSDIRSYFSFKRN